MINIRHGDCIDVMQAMDDACVDAIVTDPPYELGFMGKGWDSTGIANSIEMWREAYRVLKPGGHMLAFSSTRTHHRMVCAIEDAGFEIRDQIGWLYGSGFPKSLDVSKAIDKAAGAEREVIGVADRKASLGSGGVLGSSNFGTAPTLTAPATPDAQQWAGWGTALKPAWEPICVARKPLSEKNVAANVLAHGTGAINIDGCRVGTDGGTKRGEQGERLNDASHGFRANSIITDIGKGRWPANVITDGSDEVLEAFAAFGERKASCHISTSTALRPGSVAFGDRAHSKAIPGVNTYSDQGTAARFFYSAKASAKDRAGSKHPTVKPISLMKYLCKLVTPPGGTVLDMFAGSGTTLQAAMEEGFSAIGIEREDEYVTDIRNRIGAAREGLGLFAVAAE